MIWLIATVSGFGGGIFGSMFLEAYYQRIEHNKVHDHDVGME